MCRWAVGIALSLMITDASAQDVLRGTKAAGEQTGDIRKAWLSGETGRYPHFVLGGEYEAASVFVEDAAGRRHRLDAPADAVFEDRQVRLVDLDQDGKSEVAVVISRRTSGSALALLGLREGKLAILAESEPNGRPNRWLNPSGIGRFTGTGERQIAIVRTPHLAGVLEIYAFDGNALQRRARLEGYSTHKLGSRHQGMFAVVPKSGGGDLLIVPVLDRRSVAVLDFNRSKPEITRIPLGGAADGMFSVERNGAGEVFVNVPLDGGRRARFAVPRAAGAQ